MNTTALIMAKPRDIRLSDVGLVENGGGQLVVDALWSGVSTGTEKLLWEGRMPTFPGMGYPLVPGYETVGRVVRPGASGRHSTGELVFVPGARCHDGVKSLFGATASRLVVDEDRVYPVSESIGRDGVLLALAATAYHALSLAENRLPDLVVGHGVLGRLIARIILALGGDAPTVWETAPQRTDGARGYCVTNAFDDKRSDYAVIMDASGDTGILDLAISHLSARGEIILAGFYDKPLSFNFAPAFMREARFRIAAEFEPDDVNAVLDLVADGTLSLDGLISNVSPVEDAHEAYAAAFSDPACTKMVLDWRQGS